MGFEMRKNVVYCSNFNCAFYIHTLFVRMEDMEIIKTPPALGGTGGSVEVLLSKRHRPGPYSRPRFS